MTSEVVIDVSELEPPEPLVLTLEAADKLASGEYLRMRHRRFPCLLHDNLSERGFSESIRCGKSVACEVFIWRNGDAEAEQAALHAAEEFPPWQE